MAMLDITLPFWYQNSISAHYPNDVILPFLISLYMNANYIFKTAFVNINMVCILGSKSLFSKESKPL